MHKTLLTAALLALAAGAHAADELTNSGINNPFEGYVHGKTTATPSPRRKAG